MEPAHFRPDLPPELVQETTNDCLGNEVEETLAGRTQETTRPCLAVACVKSSQSGYQVNLYGKREGRKRGGARERRRQRQT